MGEEGAGYDDSEQIVNDIVRASKKKEEGKKEI